MGEPLIPQISFLCIHFTQSHSVLLLLELPPFLWSVTHCSPLASYSCLNYPSSSHVTCTFAFLFPTIPFPPSLPPSPIQGTESFSLFVCLFLTCLLVFMQLLFVTWAMLPPFKAPTVSPALFFSPEVSRCTLSLAVLPMSLKKQLGPMSFSTTNPLPSCLYSLEASLLLHDPDLHISHPWCFYINTLLTTLCSCGPSSFL